MPDVKEKAEAAPPPTGPKKSLIPANLPALLTKVAIFGVIGLVAIIAAFLLTTKVLKPMLANSAEPTVENAEPAPAPVEEKKEEVKAEEHGEAKAEGEGEGEGEGHGGGAAAESNYYNIESIVVNPAGTGGTRYLSCGISFEMTSSADVKTLESKSAQVKDILITILSSKTVDELADIRQRNQMRRQILVIVNKFMAPTQAKAVYLTDFVLQ